MLGAIIALVLLLTTGVNALSLAVALGTCLLTSLSVVLFGGRRGG